VSEATISEIRCSYTSKSSKSKELESEQQLRLRDAGAGEPLKAFICGSVAALAILAALAVSGIASPEERGQDKKRK